VKPVYKDGWDLPGGYVMPGESPRAACAREVREELGIEPPIGDALVVDWAPLEGGGDKILFVFDAGTSVSMSWTAMCRPVYRAVSARHREGTIPSTPNTEHARGRVRDLLTGLLGADPASAM
jgi:8-oxo-dGTP pyrophosphatase MutT (NUDIX family)